MGEAVVERMAYRAFRILPGTGNPFAPMSSPVLICVLCLVSWIGRSQDLSFELPALDTAYDPAVKSILFYRQTPEETLPVMTMARSDYLELQFDILDGSPRELYYTIFHFDQHWTPNDLRPEEYLAGFQEERVTEFAASSKTQIPYVNYRFQLRSEVFLISGNYLVCVSDRFRNVLFTRRFFVSQNNILVSVKFRDPANANLYRSHQALELTVNTNKLVIPNNGKEMNVQLFQNGDPNTLQQRNIPNLYAGELFYFNRVDDLLFKGMKEYRRKDIRTILSTTQDIQFWDEKDGQYHCWLEHDIIRHYKSYFTDYDINGKFIPMNRDREDAALESEYVMVHFTLLAREPVEQPVYIYGNLTDWQLKPEFLMEYDASRGAYQGAAWLKMGYYNFMYAVPDDKGLPDTSPMEGDWYETENDYNVLVYYRPFGSRYDQLLFAGTFNSNN